MLLSEMLACAVVKVATFLMIFAVFWMLMDFWESRICG